MKHNGLFRLAILGLVASSLPVTYTATREHIEPTNKGRRGEKDLEKLRKAESKRMRRAAKRQGR